MKNNVLKILVFVFVNSVSIAYAANGKITIITPVDGSKFSSSNPIQIKYEAIAGTNGDHLHLYIDGQRIEILTQLKGTTNAAPLSPGKHKICLEINTKVHTSTGVESCTTVTTEF